MFNGIIPGSGLQRRVRCQKGGFSVTGGCFGASPWPGPQGLGTAQLQTLDWRLEVKKSRMLRGLVLLPVLVLGGLLHPEVGLSGDWMSYRVSRVLSGGETSAAQVLCYQLMFLCGVTKYF